MTKVISVPDQAYRKLAGTTGKIMELTNHPRSMSSTAVFSLEVTDILFRMVLQLSAKDSTYREKLVKAFRKNDKEELVRLFLDAVGHN